MYNFQNYFEAKSTREAVSLLAARPDLKIIAGGTDVLIKMHGGQLDQVALLSIRDIASMQEISICENGTITVGALATFSQLATNHIIKERVPILAEASLAMGGPQIRNLATIGGNICNGATSADSAATLFTLNANLKLQSIQGERFIPIQEFFLGPGKVDLQAGELLVAIIIKQEDYQGFGGHYIKFAMRNAMDIATLGVATLCKVEGNVFKEVRIGLGVAAPVPIRCLEAEKYAQDKPITIQTIAEIGKLAVKATKARTSWRASKEYREHLVEELSQRALKVAIANAGGEDIA